MCTPARGLHRVEMAPWHQGRGRDGLKRIQVRWLVPATLGLRTGETPESSCDGYKTVGKVAWALWDGDVCRGGGEPAVGHERLASADL